MTIQNTTPPKTITATNHGLIIRVNGTGETIGCIFSWSPAMTRTITEVYQFGDAGMGEGITGSGGPGEPYEKVPGNVTGMVVRVDRYDLFTKPMEKAFGTVDLTMLSSQSNPFVVNEFQKDPDGGQTVFAYEGCWFSSIGRTHSATDDRIVKVNAELQYTRKVKKS